MTRSARRGACSAGVALACGLLGACGAEEAAPDEGRSAPALDREGLLRETRGDNLLLVSFDTTRADRLGCYGHAGAHTPNLDALARDGVRFERAMTTAPVTLPSHTSILTGLLPPQHGVRANGLFTASNALWTLPEALAEAGYTSAAFVSAEVLHGRYGLAQGFAVYDDDLGTGGGVARVERNATATTDAVLRWLDRSPPEPWFLWVHYFDPHEPLVAPERFARITANAYDAEIAYADHELGRLLRRLEQDGLSERTLACFTADHGESLDEHLEATHGFLVYDATMRVPLVFHHPALRAREVGGQVRIIDLFPTCLELLGLDAHEDVLPGLSLVPALVGEQQDPRHPALLEALLGYYSNGLAPVEAIADEEAKLILTRRPEFYDLRDDPGETRDRHDPDDPRVQRLSARLRELRGGQDFAPPAPERGLDAAERRMLRELGYLEEEGLPDAEATERMDPKDFMRLQDRRRRANQHFSARELREAEQLLVEIVAEAPADAPSLGLLGHIQFLTGRHDQAMQHLLRSIAARPDQPPAYMDLAIIHRNRRELPQALRYLESAVRYGPSFLRAYEVAIEICEHLGDQEGAASWRRRKEAAKAEG